MASFRFLHCADLHLDSPLQGLEADPEAPASRIRGATREAFAALVDYAIAHKVDFVLAAGDLYDGEWKDWRTGQFLVRQIARLGQANIPFVAISGNHDAESIITRQLTLQPPAYQMSASKPETWSLPNFDVLIHGQSFATRAVTENLSRNYPASKHGQFNIGLLHTNVNSVPDHGNYAPSNLADLRNHGYAYWALGHVHTRDILSEDPWIVYPGNLQGRHVGEMGAKGAMLVTVRDGRIAQPPEFVPFDTVRWARILVDVTGAPDEDAVLARMRASLTDALDKADGRLLAARIRLEGPTSAYAALNRDIPYTRDKLRAEALVLAGQDRIWIESVKVAVTPPPSHVATSNPLEAMIRTMDFADLHASASKYCNDLLDRAGGLRDALGERHPAVSTATQPALPPDLLEQARKLLLARLAGE